AQLPQTPRAKKVIEHAIEEARNFNHNYVGTEHLLLGILREEEGVAAQVLMNLGLSLSMVRDEVLPVVGQDCDPERPDKGQRTPSLDTYSRDLTHLARQGKLDPVIGREQEIEQLLVILNCRQRNSPLLVGEPGVGKSAVLHGLAQRLIERNPLQLPGGYRLV